ncbi:MAG: TetR/AcrR family transcriptional regulator [Gammaproteobacteria bacterium]|jgi:AcrR family transcriptional regulator|nr:TetR/AcrR family transcriptional regulator [Zhongshania sp.]MBU0537592.1 TetR/AcrR family transcriptional regulator [Gammaproteobacteria bacterium]MBU1832538.1 TetR/AcrR family transcriptional regulator [Gammaproteobacteria bacterium]
MKTNKRWGNGARVDDLDTGKKILLKSAVDCFITKGIKSTTIEDVAKVANVTRRTVYRYFNGKSDIIAALIDIERERMFIKIHDIAKLYDNNFPLMLEECIWFAASYKPPEAGKLDLVSGANASEASPHIDNEESDEYWRELLKEPLDAYNLRNNRNVNLDDLIQIVGRLVLSYRQLPSTKERFKASLLALAL